MPPVTVFDDEHDQTKLLYMTSQLIVLSFNNPSEGRIV